MRHRPTIRKHLLTGLAIWLPVVVTFYLLRVVFLAADGMLGRYINAWLVQHGGRPIPGLGLLLGVVLLFVTGYVTNQFFGKRFVRGLEGWFGGLPVIRHIYPPAKQMADLVFTQENRLMFRRIVMVPYPSRGLYSLGFVTNEGVAAIDAKAGKHLIAVFVPSPPSPITGNMIFAPAEDVLPLDLTVEEGMALIVSGGVVGPGKAMQGPASRLPHTS